MPAKIYLAAQARLLEIWDYTERTWGEAQADAYVRELSAAAHLACDDRARWRSVKSRTILGVFFIRHRNHFIFFRELSSGEIGVISILHEKMDLPARLLEDVKSHDS